MNLTLPPLLHFIPYYQNVLTAISIMTTNIPTYAVTTLCGVTLPDMEAINTVKKYSMQRGMAWHDIALK